MLKESKAEKERESKAESAERRKRRQEAQRQRESGEAIGRPTSIGRRRVDKQPSRPEKTTVSNEIEVDEAEEDMSSYFRRKIASLLDEEKSLASTTTSSVKSPTSSPRRKRVEFEARRSKFMPDEEDMPLRASSNHDRLQKICSVAWDLQNKIEQTKLALERFGVDRDVSLSPVSSSLSPTRQRRGRVGSSPGQLSLARSPRTRKSRELSVVSEDDDDYATGDMTNLPGVKVFRPNDVQISRDLAARRIQSAYRLYAGRRVDRVTSRRPPQTVRSATRAKSQPARKVAESLVSKLHAPFVDEYNFINIYHKKNPNGFGSPRRPDISFKKMSLSGRKSASMISDSRNRKVTLNF